MTDDTSPNGSSVDDGIRRDSHAEMDTGTGSDPSVMLDRGMPSLDGRATIVHQLAGTARDHRTCATRRSLDSSWCACSPR